MPKGNSNSLGAERLEQTSEQFLGKVLKKLVANFLTCSISTPYGM